MNSTQNRLVKQAYTTPSLRASIVNRGMITLYCDYSGNIGANTHGVACCMVHNREISVSAKKLQMKDLGSDYGELLAIRYSLEILTNTLSEHQENIPPKVAIVLTDCHCIARILSSKAILNKSYATLRNTILASLDNLHNKFPDIQVKITHLRNYKKINALHRLAHNAARSAIGK